jgi:hypothetical protein
MLLNQYTAQNTLGIAGISKQLCAEAVKMGFLVPINCSNIDIDGDSLVHLFTQLNTLQALNKVCAEISTPLKVSTCYRTLAQQYILKRNLTSLVANVGRSNHGDGSLDITNYGEHRGVLEQHGFSQTYADRDPVHFDFDGAEDKRIWTVIAFQKLWNRNNDHQIAADGIVGSGTLMALSNTPVNGFVDASEPRYLSFHDAGKDVGNLQFKLRELGFLAGICDGLFGNQTQAAVIKFQIKAGINPSGIVGYLTRQLLFS